MELSYIYEGTGDALLLLHGYPFDHSMWEGQIESLSDSYRVVAPDLRGFGKTPLEAEEPSIDRYADDVAELLDRLKIPHAVVAGMSMGGYVALSFAARHSARLAGLGLIDTQPGADTEEARAGRRKMIERVRAEGTAVAAEAMIPRLFAAANAKEESFAKFPRAGAAAAGVEGISWALEAMARRPDRTELLATIRVPSLVLVGVEDVITPPEKARAMKELLPDAVLVEIPGAGHATPIESPQAVADALRDLLGRSFC